MPIFDTHCHYNLEPLYSGQAFCFKIKDTDPVLKMNWQEHWQNAQRAGIDKSIVVGPGITSSRLAVEIASTQTNLYAAVGIHPERANKIDDLNQALLELTKLARHPKVVAIGESGLDYYYLDNASLDETESIKQKQKILFIKQIELANQLNLPLILHVRDRGDGAYLETLDLVEKHWSFAKALIFHCASGPTINYVERALQMKNSYFGFGGNITFKKADEVRMIFTLVQNTDSKKILLETDAPYLAPEPHRGRICEPMMIADTANYVAQQFNADLAEIYQNSLRAFNIN